MLPAGKHVVDVYHEVAPLAGAGTLFIDCSTVDMESARKAHAIASEHGLRSDRRAGVGRHGGRGGRHADLHGRRVGGSVCAGRACAAAHGRQGRALRRGRRGTGGEDLQQHDLGRVDDRGRRGLRSRRKARPVAPGALRRGVDLVGAMLVADQLLPGTGSGAEVARQPRLQAGFRGCADDEGFDAGAGGGGSSGAFTPLGSAAAELYERFNESGHGSEDFSAIIRYPSAAITPE